MGTKDVIVREMPTGYRFLPTDEKLVKYYLVNKVIGGAIPADVIQDIHASQLYNKPPKNIATMNPNCEEEWYFFIHKDEYFHGERKQIPVVENGTSYWSSIGEEEIICNSKGDVIAFKLKFIYFSGTLPKDWYMEKYRIPLMPANTNSLEMNEWVLARLHNGRRTTAIL
ncbi:protein ATAF2-like [Cornus florida]|uniref:protein ATAF2-like n=1 Tax=Cornus florida TaxID=4283 RepID=UPI00289DAC84|nr:protein ATAF2-like [Cornus florida]